MPLKNLTAEELLLLVGSRPKRTLYQEYSERVCLNAAIDRLAKCKSTLPEHKHDKFKRLFKRRKKT